MASSNNTSRIVELAAQISSSVTELQQRLSAQGAPAPSFDEDSPENLPSNVVDLKDSLLDATAELHELLLDPLMLLFKFASISNLVSIDAVCRYHIPDMIPHGGTITFEEIAEKTGLEKSFVRRLLRHAMAMRIFKEPEPGVVAHTSISKFLTIPYINSWVQFESRDTWPATTRVVDAIQKWPNSGEMGETGFALANDNKSVLQVLGTEPERAMRFMTGMKSMDHLPGHATADIATVYDWASLGDAQVVHIGGSRGEIAVEIVKNFGNLRVLVQDSAPKIQGADSAVPEEVKDRVEFMPHELFETQSVKAQVYFIRMIFRTLADKYAVGILKALIPALQPGVKILIQDVCMPETDAIPLWRERTIRGVDMAIGTFFNGRERYLDEWKALLAAADDRFVLYKVHVPEDNLLGILEIHWDSS